MTLPPVTLPPVTPLPTLATDTPTTSPPSLAEPPPSLAAEPPTPPADGSPLALWENRSAREWARRLGAATAEFHARIASTSDRARELVRSRLPLPALVVADRQSAGRGRQGRRWESDTPLGLWLTAAVAAAPSSSASVLPLRIGLALARTLESLVPGLRLSVKWPNDLTTSGGKLGGVLCERAGDAVLVGIGLNLAHSLADLPSGLDAPATSLLLETGQTLPRGRALPAAWSATTAACRVSGDSLSPGERAALNRRSPLRGRRVVANGVALGSEGGARAVHSLHAVAGGIAPDGALLLRDEHGAAVRLVTGSVVPSR